MKIANGFHAFENKNQRKKKEHIAVFTFKSAEQYEVTKKKKFAEDCYFGSTLFPFYTLFKFRQFND